MIDNDYPIWYCVMKREDLNNRMYMHRFLVAEKTTVGEIDDMYMKHGHLFETPGSYSMIFYREPEDNPLQDTVKREAFLL